MRKNLNRFHAPVDETPTLLDAGSVPATPMLQRTIHNGDVVDVDTEMLFQQDSVPPYTLGGDHRGNFLAEDWLSTPNEANGSIK